jgi:hypothetical protein
MSDDFVPHPLAAWVARTQRPQGRRRPTRRYAVDGETALVRSRGRSVVPSQRRPAD